MRGTIGNIIKATEMRTEIVYSHYRVSKLTTLRFSIFISMDTKRNIRIENVTNPLSVMTSTRF